ncbi:unnamed protein product [Allacma fusca]|uniref:DNA-directed DNA polymerase n=1 Tax=Allacma fusca TaxID=39272 RepID=A0A8J2JF11_9HEXA|nr:unnamed protein product [Allacma fusca]
METNKFPHSDFQWENVEQLKKINWLSPEIQSRERTRGYILETTLEIPPALQDISESLPLVPERRHVQLEDLSPDQIQTMNSLGAATARTYLSTSKLLSTFYEKKHYVLHYRVLMFYLRMGVVLKDIHSGFSFEEKAFLKSFIESNTEKRKRAKTDSEEALLKLVNNGTFGKFLQSGENMLTIRFCGGREKARQLLSMEGCVDFDIINEHLCILKFKPTSIMLNKPLQVGMSVLDFAKEIFYSGVYEQLGSMFDKNMYSIFTDTDSTLMEIQGNEKDIWRKIVARKEMFDFSKIPKDHEIFTMFPEFPDLREFNRNSSGKWKIESLDVSQSVTLKSKQYSLIYHNQASKPLMKNKGIPSATLETFCSHDTYKNVVVTTDPCEKVKKVDVSNIRSYNHVLYKTMSKKLGFHCLDFSRVYPKSNDYNYSLPFGSYKLSNM